LTGGEEWLDFPLLDTYLPFQKSIEQLTDKLINRPESIFSAARDPLPLNFPTETAAGIGFAL
jgi:hypothetical protein